MGKREVHICDVCKEDIPFDANGPVFQAAKVSIQLYKRAWGDPEYIASFEGELCGGCTAIINRAAESFHRELQARVKNCRPGERMSSEKAAVKPPKKKGRRT